MRRRAHDRLRGLGKGAGGSPEAIFPAGLAEYSPVPRAGDRRALPVPRQYGDDRAVVHHFPVRLGRARRGGRRLGHQRRLAPPPPPNGRSELTPPAGTPSPAPPARPPPTSA